MDLFYGDTFEDQIKALKKDIKVFAKSKYDYDYGRKRIYIAYGKKENIGDNVLIVTSPFAKDAKPFEDKGCKFLLETLKDHNIFKFFVTPQFIIPKDNVSTRDIKEYSKLANNLVDILQPKLIVVLGEPSTFMFFKRKFILRDHHGTIIGSHGSIPIILSYAPEYYIEKSQYEDPSFKQFILENDWSFIATNYKEKIKDEQEETDSD